jgi:hypothetical protein
VLDEGGGLYLAKDDDFDGFQGSQPGPRISVMPCGYAAFSFASIKCGGRTPESYSVSDRV